MEAYYEQKLKEKEAKEAEERRKIELAKQNEDQYSQFEESDGTPMPHKYLSPAIRKKIESVKDEFGQEFLKMYQKTLFDTIKKSSGEKSKFASITHYKKTFPKDHPLVHSNGEIPRMMVFNYQSNQPIYRIAKNNSDTAFLPPTNKFQTLQNNIDFFRHESGLGYRRHLGNMGIPQKYWPNGRPRGSLERHISKDGHQNQTRVEQGLYSGIQGIAMSKSNRTSTTGYYRKKGFKTPKKTKKKKIFTKEDILRAVERLSSMYGTPFTIDGHKEKLIESISKNPTLQNTLLKSDSSKEDNFTSNIKEEKTYFSVPVSGQKPRPYNENPLRVDQISTIKTSQQQVRRTVRLNLGEGLSTRKYLIPYQNSKDAEKEKILNLFGKLFKEFNFNKKEDKDLILRQIRKLYPSALYLSGKKIDSILKAFMTNAFQRGRILVNISKLKEFIRDEKAQLKHTKSLRTEQKIVDNKPIFVKLAGTQIKKLNSKALVKTCEAYFGSIEPSETRREKQNPNVVHLRTFNIPMKLTEKAMRKNRMAYLGTNRRGKSSGRINNLQSLRT